MNFSAGIKQECNRSSASWETQSPALCFVTQHNHFASELGPRFTVLRSRFEDMQVLP